MVSRKKRDNAIDTPNQDAIALLISDHQRITRLFAAFNKLKDGDEDDQKAQIVAQLCAELSVHTQIEEEIFYPAVRRTIDDDDLMDEAWVQQEGAKNLFAQLKQADPGDDFYDAKVAVLAEEIDHHVQEEEKDMFPQARRSGLNMEILGARMLGRKAELFSAANAGTPRVSICKRPKAHTKRKATRGTKKKEKS